MLRQPQSFFILVLLCLSVLTASSPGLPAPPQENDSLYNYYPQPPQLNPGDTVFVINSGAMNSGERLLISTLAGVVAQKKPRIYIQLGAGYLQWLQDLETRYGLLLTYTFQNDPWGLVSRLKTELNEPAYLLCSVEESSVNVATSLSGIWGVVAVAASIENEAQAAGLRLKMDVRGKDEAWCFQNYWQEFYSGLLIQQKESLLSLRDYGPLARAFTFFDGNSDFMRQVMAAADDDSPILGWGDASQGEDKFVQPASEASLFTIPSDHAWNLSLFSGVPVDSLFQRTHVNEPLISDSVHTVTFVMSDGDNIQWLMNDFATNEKWYGSSLRGQFNMGWTISPSMVALAPSIMDRLYRDAATTPGRDFFVCGVSGGGYLYPSYFSKLGTHGDRLNEFLKAADLNIITILEHRRGYFTPELLDSYTRQPQVIGCLYLDYARYDYYAGKIIWSHGKPIVSARFNLWESFDTPESISAWINLSPRDPTSPAAYSFINVHPWSKSLAEVQRTISLFNEHVQVVTPEEFIKRIATNVPHQPSGIREKRSPALPGKMQIKVFPNPVDSNQTGKNGGLTINIRTPNNELLQRVRIVDVLGRTIREWRGDDLNKNRENNFFWEGKDQNGIPATAGIYFIQVFMKDIVESHKFVVLR